MSDGPRHDAPDTARPTATAYPLTPGDVSRLFDEAGLPRNVRTSQRYCAAGRVDGIKEETAKTVRVLTIMLAEEYCSRQGPALTGTVLVVRTAARRGAIY
jgi:hypothetical protein